MKIVLNIDVETLVREEIRNFIRENLVINNVSATVEAEMDTAFGNKNDALKDDVTITIHQGNISESESKCVKLTKLETDKDTNPPISPTNVQWEYAPKPGRRRNNEEIALHKGELKLGRVLTPEEKGKVKAGVEIDTNTENKSKEDAIKKAKYDEMAKEGMDAASKELIEEEKTETGPEQSDSGKEAPSTSELFSNEASVDKPKNEEVEVKNDGETTIPIAQDLGNLNSLFS